MGALFFVLKKVIWALVKKLSGQTGEGKIHIKASGHWAEYWLSIE